MRERYLIAAVVLLLFAGCGGGGSSDSSPPTGVVTGSWSGGMTFTVSSGSSETMTFHMNASLIESGASVSGTYDLHNISEFDQIIHSGVFTNTFRSENTLSGILVSVSRSKGAPFFDSPMPFNATISNISIAGNGLVSMDGVVWSVTFTLTKVSEETDTDQRQTT